MRKYIVLSTVFVALNYFNANCQTEKIQSAFIYQLTKHIDWCPALKGGDFVIATLGETSLTQELKSLLQSKTVGPQNISVKSVSSLSNISGINILVIPKNKSGQLSAALKQVEGKCTLVVTEELGLGKQGAGVNLIEQDGKMVLELNKSYCSNHDLTVSSRLFNFAKVIN
jgi:hypothetical protein